MTSVVLCSVDSVPETLAEFIRVLKPGGKLRLIEHVRSEHWLAGPLMDLSNPLWLWINKVGCNWNRRTVETIAESPIVIDEVERHKLYTPANPARFSLRLIKARETVRCPSFPRAPGPRLRETGL